MIFQLLAGNLTHGLLLGGVYGLATMGLSLIFGVMNVVNVGHGGFIMVGAFIVLTMFTALGVSPVLAIPVALFVGMALGFFFFYTVMRRLIKGPELVSLLGTFAMGILLEETAEASLNAADYVYIMHEGRIKAEGKPDVIKGSPDIREAYLGI